MKKIIALIAASALFFGVPVCKKSNEVKALDETSIVQTTSGRDKIYAEDLSENWMFGGRALDDSDVILQDYNDESWENIDIPHTWNIYDGSDGGNNYDRASYWYRKIININKETGKKIYIEFLGANQKTDLYVNGTHAVLPDGTYQHRGGYTSFRYDITDCAQDGENIIAVKVDNSKDEAIAPISGDFNMYGGIYRKIYLLTINDVHVDVENNGSSGLFLTTPNSRSLERPEDLGCLNIKTDIVNDSETDRNITITAQIIGDNAPEPIIEDVSLEAGGSYAFDHDIKIEDPHLWNGIDYSEGADNSDVGYRYTVEIIVSEDGNVLDKVSDKVGFRYFWVDKDTGFYLNGEHHPLRGVNRHQYRRDCGSALTEEDHNEDIELIKELGANTVRLCHYPQADYFYDLCDENGIIVWTEIPVVNQVGTSEEFDEVTKAQLVELIRQQYNRPCVCFWGLQNEVGNGRTSNSFMNMKQLMDELDALAKQEDSSGRYTVQAVNQDYSMNQNLNDESYSDYSNNTGWRSDLISWNIYPGWYGNFSGTFSDVMESKKVRDSRPMGISEYGWGANVNQHESYPELNKNDLTPYGPWHPEEYQNLMHEAAIEYINENEYLWSTYIWAMFDFEVDSRNEGSQKALNDKGLITSDRQIKKDSFYLYKANWNKLDTFVHITSSRFSPRDDSETYIKVYSNCDNVELFKNGESLGDMENMGNGVFLKENVSLEVGNILIEAKGTKAGSDTEYTDQCEWTRNISDAAEITSQTLRIDNIRKTVIVDKDISAAQFRNEVFGVNNAVYKIYSGGTEITDDSAWVIPGMEIRVIAEDGKTEALYKVTAANLCAGKSVKATSNEAGNEAEHAVDSDGTSRWVAVNNSYPQSIEVDLGCQYIMSGIEIDWYADKNRYYSYDIEISSDGQDYKKIIDRTSNTLPGNIYDSMKFSEGRYVRINVYGCSNSSGYAALYEIRLDGWNLLSDIYEIDNENRLIIVPEVGDEAGMTPNVLLSNLQINGNCTYEIKVGTGYVNDGDTLIITDPNGRQAVYTVSLKETANDKTTNLALYKNVYCSSEEGLSTDGADTYAESAVDGDLSTRWSAETNGGTEASYPEWIGVDLGKLYSISNIDIKFETKADRKYSYIVYGSEDVPLISGSEDIPDDYFVISDRSDNNEAGGIYNIDCGNRNIRYIAVKILGCDKWSENTMYVAASIYEIAVNGRAVREEQQDKIIEVDFSKENNTIYYSVIPSHLYDNDKYDIYIVAYDNEGILKELYVNKISGEFKEKKPDHYVYKAMVWEKNSLKPAEIVTVQLSDDINESEI